MNGTEKSKWSHLIHVDQERVGRDWHTTVKGFASKEEAEEYGRYYEENLYAYFPRILKIWQDGGFWYLTMRVADSCD